MPYYDYNTNRTDYDPIEQEIVDALNAFGPVAQCNNYTNGDWTNGVKGIFGAIGYKKEYKIFSAITDSKRPFNQIRQDVQQMLGGLYVPIKWQHKNQGRDQFLGEWLYDILWWDENDQGYAINIPLVAESEWGDTVRVKEDFQKLLLARSKYRVMIFECGNDIIKWSKDQIKKFNHTQTGDRYLFCSWRGNALGFHFELYVAP